LELVGSLIILLLGQNFLGLTYIIVYIGALAILFLFVIMMLKPDFTPSLPPYLSLSLLLIVIALSFTSYPGFLITPNWTNSFLSLTDIEAMGYMIYVSYPILLIYIGISLLLVLIGIITILGYKKSL
jgi:NADH:ubiquinone oxidoreductase subunit 6 (subunit J)